MKTDTPHLEELVHKFINDKDIPRRRKHMTKMICSYVCEAMGVNEIKEIPVHKLKAVKRQLSTYLNNTCLSENTKASYNGFFSRLLAWGVEQGHIQMGFHSQLSKIWHSLTYPLKGVSSGRMGWRNALRRLAYWATSQGVEPDQLDYEILLSFIDHLRDDSGIQAWRQIYHRAQKEWDLHAQNGKVDFLNWPVLPSGSRSKYSLMLHEWPQAMQIAYQIYRKWCLAVFINNRDPKYHQRPVSADQNLSNLERIAGFAHNIQGKQISSFSMDMFFDETLINEYIEWMINIRNAGKIRVTQKRLIAQLLGMAKGYYNNIDASHWLVKLQNNLVSKPVKNKKEVLIPLEDLMRVPDTIKQKRLNIERNGRKKNRNISMLHQAKLFMEELMYRFLLERPIRQKNLREMKLDFNLVHQNDGHWLVKYKGEEMKNGLPFQFPFPIELEPMLVEYLKKYRHSVCNGYDSEYVFPNPNGGHIDARVIQRMVHNYTIEALGKPMNPHLIRDCVAYDFLKENPGQYLILSQLLAHSDPNTTIQIYGHFEAEEAVVLYDRWRKNKRQEARSTHSNGKEEKYVARG
jgi:integrase